MASYDAQINILVAGQRNISNLANQLNAIEDSIQQIERRWRTASAALQRSQIRLGVTGTQQPRGQGGRFARDPDRQARFAAFADRRRAQVEQRLSRFTLSRANAEALAARAQIDNNERILRQTERRISLESRLNSANELFQRRLQQLSRGGGGRGLPQDLQNQVRSIEAAYNAAGGAGSRNLRLVRDLATELGRVVERQNEFNRLQALSSKGFEAGRRLQERIANISGLGVQPESRIRRLRRGAETVIQAARSGDQQAYSEALRRATAATARIERESNEAAKRIAKFALRSPVLGGVNFPGSPKALEAQRKAEQLALSAAQKGYPASPIGGTATMVGSPRFLALQERARAAAERALRAQERSAKAAESAANKEADRVLRESQKGFPSSPIMGTATMAGSPKAIAAQERNRAAAERRAAAQRRVEERAVKVQQQVAVAAERAADKALKEAQKGFPSSPILGSSTVEGSPRWKAAQESARQKLESAARAAERAADRALKEAQKGFPSSPILGTATMTGSPRWKAAQERMSRMARGGASKESGFRPALTSAEVKAQINEIVTDFNAVAPKAGSVGDNIASTFATELKQGASSAAAAAKTFAAAALEAIKDVFGIASPSRVMKEIAENLVSSFITELVSNIPSVKAALEQTFSAKGGEYEQPGRARTRGPSLKMEGDPRFFAALSGEPLSTGRPSPAGIFPAATPRVGAPGSAFPFQTYGMSRTQFPSDVPAVLRAPRNQLSDTSAAVSEAIKEYRAAVNNFWEGEDSQFEAITKILTSSARLGAARLARRLQQGPDLTQAERIVEEARTIAAGQRRGTFAKISDVITGDTRLGISSAVASTYQRISDSLLNSLEALGFTVSDGFKDAIDRVRNAVPSVLGGIAGILPPGGFGGGRGGGGAAGAGGGAPQSVDALQRALGLGDLAPIARATGEQIDELTARLSELRKRIDPTTQDFAELTKQLGVLGREQERRAPDAGFLTRRFGPRGGRAVSEGLVGGAFPLLFGQGLGAAVGGGAGGALGGFAGGGLGFGLSLAGTALGTAFDTLNQAAQETGKALRYPVDAFEQLKDAGLIATRQQEYYIQKLIESGRMAEAAAEIQSEVIKKIGVQGVKDLQQLGDSSSRLSKAWAEFNLQLQAALAGPMADLLDWVGGIVSEINRTNRQTAELRDFMQSLTPQQQQEYFRRSIELRNQNNGVVDPAAIQRLQREFLPNGVQQPQAALTQEQLDAQKQAQAVTQELQAQVALQAKQLSLTGLTLERDGARYVNAARAVALQEYDNKLLEIKNGWIGKIFNAEQNLARIRGANLELAAKLRQINEEIARRQEELYMSGLQAEAALYDQRQRTIDLLVRIAAFSEGEEAGLNKQLSLMDNLYMQRLAAYEVEKEIALIEASRNGTTQQVLALFDERLKQLNNEHALEEGITKQKLAQIQLNKFIAAEEAKRQAADPFVQFRKAQELDQQYAQTYFRLLREGVIPAEAERLASFQRLVSERLSAIDSEIAFNQILLDQAVNAKAGADRINELTTAIENLKAARGVTEQQALEGAGPAPQKIPGAKIQEFISTAEEELKDFEGLAIRVSQGIGDAVGNSLANGITGLIEGTTTAKEIFAGFLKDVGQILIREGAKMIATYIAIGIAKQFAGLFTQSSAAKNFEMPDDAFIPKGGFKFPGAANGAYFDGGMSYFANGGIVTSPTLFQFADGGIPRMGLMGEAGPEAIMPLKRGVDGKLGVQVADNRAFLEAASSGDAGNVPATADEESVATVATRAAIRESERLQENRTQIINQQMEHERRYERERIEQMASTPGNLNIRYESQVINSVEYVTREQAERMAAQSALRGRELAIGSLQNSVKTRKRVGMA